MIPPLIQKMLNSLNLFPKNTNLRNNETQKERRIFKRSFTFGGGGGEIHIMEERRKKSQTDENDGYIFLISLSPFIKKIGRHSKTGTENGLFKQLQSSRNRHCLLILFLHNHTVRALQLHLHVKVWIQRILAIQTLNACIANVIYFKCRVIATPVSSSIL